LLKVCSVLVAQSLDGWDGFGKSGGPNIERVEYAKRQQRPLSTSAGSDKICHRMTKAGTLKRWEYPCINAPDPLVV